MREFIKKYSESVSAIILACMFLGAEYNACKGEYGLLVAVYMFAGLFCSSYAIIKLSKLK